MTQIDWKSQTPNIQL